MVNLRYLLDTNALSEPLKPRPHAGYLRRLYAHRLQVAIAATTWHEALFGLHRLPAGRRSQEVGEYLFDVVLPAVPILPYDAAAAEWHAQERARLEGRGRAAPYADGEIAAVAHVHDLVLVTANRRDFAGFSGVALEDWWA